MTMLQLQDVHKAYDKLKALDGVDLAAEAGEILVLAGPSGAGKTTTLHVAAGVLEPDAGEVRFDGRDIRRIPPWKRNVALMQETYALYPHMTTFENIIFPLRSPLARTRLSEQEMRERAEKVGEMLEIGHLFGNPIQHLSGGQRQRVGLARALVREPQYFLLDEPISHLDAKLRHWLRGELRRYLTSMGHPCIWATPDGKEALSVADRLAVIEHGRVIQVGSPRDVYSSPATARVAEIVSDPPIGLVHATLDGAGPVLRLDGVLVPIPLSVAGAPPIRSGKVLAGVRPSSIRLANGGAGVITPGQVLAQEPTTRETIVSVQLGDQTLRVFAEPFADFRIDEAVSLDWEGALVYLFDGRSDEGGGGRLLGEARVVGPSSRDRA